MDLKRLAVNQGQLNDVSLSSSHRSRTESYVQQLIISMLRCCTAYIEDTVDDNDDKGGFKLNRVQVSVPSCHCAHLPVHD